jgi:hypothetical protein
LRKIPIPINDLAVTLVTCGDLSHQRYQRGNRGDRFPKDTHTLKRVGLYGYISRNTVTKVTYIYLYNYMNKLVVTLGGDRHGDRTNLGHRATGTLP